MELLEAQTLYGLELTLFALATSRGIFKCNAKLKFSLSNLRGHIVGSGGISPLILKSAIRWRWEVNFTQPKHIIFQPGKRRRSNFIPTSILIFRASWSLYSHPTRIWYNFSHHLPRKKKEGSIRKFRNDLCNNSNWIAGIRGMSTPHIYSRNRRWYTSVL